MCVRVCATVARVRVRGVHFSQRKAEWPLGTCVRHRYLHHRRLALPSSGCAKQRGALTPADVLSDLKQHFVCGGGDGGGGGGGGGGGVSLARSFH